MRGALMLAIRVLQLAAALPIPRGWSPPQPLAVLGRRSLAGIVREVRALDGDDVCRSALSQAFTLCRSSPEAAPGAPCCAALKAAGGDCLRQAEAAAAASAAAEESWSTLLGQCGADGSSSRAGTEPSQLPEGQVQLSWSLGADAAPCFNYLPSPDGNWTVDTTSGPWGAAGNATPPAEDVERVSELLCSAPQEDGGQELLQALAAGGGAAQAAVAAARSGCANSSSALNAAFYEAGQSDELQRPATVLRYAEAFRDAAEAVGAGACVTVVVLDPSGSLMASRKVHTSSRRPAPTSGSSSGRNSSAATSSGGNGTVSSSSVEAMMQACLQAFLPALRACNGSRAGLEPRSSCCAAVEGVGQECLGQLAASLQANQTRLAELEQILGECGIGGNLPAGGRAQPPAPSPAAAPSTGAAASSSSSSSSSGAGSDTGSEEGSQDGTPPAVGGSAEGSSIGGGSRAANGTLPDGRTALFLSIAAGPVPCYSYTPGQESNWTADPARGLWKGVGGAVPPDDALDVLSDELCGSPERGAAALLAAFEVGGGAAQAAVAIILGNGSCMNPAAVNAAVGAFGDAPEMNDPGLVLSFVDTLVAAADEIGAGVCVSVASIDWTSGDLLDFREVHVSGRGSSASSSSSSSGGDSDGSGSGDSAAPGAGSGAVDITAGDNSTLPELPAGNVLTAWSVGPSGQCAAYDESSGEWRNAATFPFGGSGHGVPPRAAYESIGRLLCESAGQAAATLVEAMAAGGEEARVAAAALLSYSCPEGPPQMQAAFDAFTNAIELRDPETALRYTAAFVEAANAVGGGACVALVVTSESGAVLAAYRLHTNGPAGGALLEEPGQEGSAIDGGEPGSDGGGDDEAARELDWVHSFLAASQAVKQ